MSDMMTHAAGRLAMPEFVAIPLWQDALKRFDQQVKPDLSNAPELLTQVPLAAFGATLLEPKVYYPRASGFLPVMPSDQVQRDWTGTSGSILLESSVAFISHVVAAAGGAASLRNKTVLDFGIGWGRLARLWLKYMPPAQLLGCDAWEQSLMHANDSRLQNKLVLSDALLRTLPFEKDTFDLAYAFSIFTHLSEASFRGCLRGLRDMLKVGGQLVFTVRPRNFWALRTDLKQQAALLKTTTFTFLPSNGLTDFGDTTVSADWLAAAVADAGLELEGLEWSPVDALQVLVIARRTSK
jgi:2-polyprenyl-3-methyl-5-hydroxy-6-metoxy-1,4-benzoquinol methylase